MIFVTLMRPLRLNDSGNATIVCVRVSTDTLNKVKAICELESSTVSVATREALAAWVDSRLEVMG